MMDTPICDFVRRYAQSGTLRLHMPGHKGVNLLGMEALDITEVAGADSLYEADGIIAQSEENASRLFGCPTFYATEGSSQCIRAMVHLATRGGNGRIAAGRNAHKTFLSAAALLDLQVDWLFGQAQNSYLSCPMTPADLEDYFANCTEKPAAVYVTSPDYLGNLLDIAGLARVCHSHDTLLLVDNAHGAYLRFLPQSLHPMDLGADACCDSAHKTLPVLTGGAYLHIRSEKLAAAAKEALALFGSTSPSYLILQSLDAANAYLAHGYREKLAEFVNMVAQTKESLADFRFLGGEPMKLTLDAKAYGYLGTELAQLLRQQGVECEFADPDDLVLMPTPELGAEGLRRVAQALAQIPRKAPVQAQPPAWGHPRQVCSVRRALLSPGKTVAVEESLGKVLASPSVGCPPAVPILVCGEQIDEQAIAAFRYYGIENCIVMDT